MTGKKHFFFERKSFQNDFNVQSVKKKQQTSKAITIYNKYRKNQIIKTSQFIIGYYPYKPVIDLYDHNDTPINVTSDVPA